MISYTLSQRAHRQTRRNPYNNLSLQY
jgi:hypothetical protein